MHGLIKKYMSSGKVGINAAMLSIYRRSPMVLREQAVYALAALLRGRLPPTRFVVFAQGRSGSTLLVDLLNSHPDVFTFGEIMALHVVQNLKSPRRFAEGICALSKRPATGFKVKLRQISIGQRKDPTQVLRDFHKNGWKIIYLKRANVLRHAVSDIRTELTGEYHNVKGSAVGGKAATRRTIRLDPDELFKVMGCMEAYLAEEAAVLESIPHLQVEYERDLLEREAQRQTANRIFGYLGLPESPAETSFQKVTSRNVADDIENFSEVEQRLRGTRYADMLSWG